MIKNLGARNPDIKIGKYAINIEERETGDDNTYPSLNIELDNNDWWLRNTAGERVTWTSQYSTWEINITKWSGKNKWGDTP